MPCQDFLEPRGKRVDILASIGAVSGLRKADTAVRAVPRCRRMKVLLRFKGESEVTWITEMSALPGSGQLFETGLQTWCVRDVEFTPAHPKYEAVINLVKPAGSS